MAAALRMRRNSRPNQPFGASNLRLFCARAATYARFLSRRSSTCRIRKGCCAQRINYQSSVLPSRLW
eukprot:5684505-Pyramimonas_sp.AAC.1